MLTNSPRRQLVVGAVLVTLMIATRGVHPIASNPLPDASWAVFFLAGVYLQAVWVLPALLAFAWLLDLAAFTWGGVSDFCLTPAYGFLIPAYGMLWFAGRWYAGRHRDHWLALVPLAASVLVGTVACELVSSGSFYFLSGRFAETTLTGFGSRLAQYFPGSLQSVAGYVAAAALVHTLFRRVQRTSVQRRSAAQA